MQYLSVAMATYNGAKYLVEQLDSILAQTLAPDEIIIVDDCSIDNTWQVLSEYALRCPQIKLYRNDANFGVVKTFEVALSLCTSEFIALADQDDYWLPNKLELLMANIGSNWLIHSDAYIVDENLNQLAVSFNNMKAYHNDSIGMYYMRNNVTGCTILMHRNLLNLALPFPSNLIMHDHYLALCAKFFDKLIYLNKPLIKYRQHSQNVIGSGVTANYSTMISNYNNHINFLDSLLSVKRIKFDIQQITTVRDYFFSIINVKIPKLSTLKWILQHLGFGSVLSLLAYTVVSRNFANYIFDLKRK